MELFRLGVAPGPHCLLKLLRHRFGQQVLSTGTTHEEENQSGSREKYGKEEATAEYEQRVAALKKYQALRKVTGHMFRCADCHQRYPAAAFGADAKSLDDVREKCLRKGYWLHCIPCRTACDAAKAAGFHSAEYINGVWTCHGELDDWYCKEIDCFAETKICKAVSYTHLTLPTIYSV